MEITSLETTLVDGRRVLFRPIEASDKERLQEGLKLLSPESRYRRFFRHIDHFTEHELQYLTEVDGTDHVAWIAILPDESGEPGVGVARWIRVKSEPDVAEAAVTVVDAFHHKGIGRTLLWIIGRVAIEKGVKYFRAYTMGENSSMLGVLESFGAIPGKWDGGVLELTVPLPTDPDALALTPSPLLLREVAGGRLEAHAEPSSPAGARFVPPGS